MQDGDGNTALFTACERGHVETARVLLDHGAATDYQNKVTPFNAHLMIPNIIIVAHQQLFLPL